MKTEKHVVILWLIISLLLPTLACAQYKFDNVLYGAAYYHEYMPTDRLDKDIQMMKELWTFSCSCRRIIVGLV